MHHSQTVASRALARAVRRPSAPSATNATRQGTCDPATGACSHPTKPDGTACGRWRCAARRSIAAQPGNASRAELADRCQGLHHASEWNFSKGTASFVPAQGIRLADALEARAFDVKKIASLCVAAELGGTAVAGARSPRSPPSLSRLPKGSAKHVSRRNLSIIDGLGEFGVDTVRADTLMASAPTFTSTSSEIAQVDRFTCYKLATTKGARKISPKNSSAVSTTRWSTVRGCSTSGGGGDSACPRRSTVLLHRLSGCS